MDHTEENKISKIYNQNTNTGKEITFQNVQQAKDFFLTQEAKDLYDRYCYKQEWRLTNENRSLHWTVSFKLYHNVDKEYIPNSTLWKNKKDQITKIDGWFLNPNHPIITHDATHLF